MQREQLNFVCEDNGYLKGGTKEACVKIRYYISNMKRNGKEVTSSKSCISFDEFISSVQVLMAYAFKKEDEVSEFYKCDSDCRKVSHLLCPGECSVISEAEKMCPFFEDEFEI